jgi:cation:H+ antiporter
MIESLSLTIKILIFIISGGVIWYFSNKLSHIVDFINDEYKLGAAFGGTILLSVIVNLPEVAIVIKGTLQGDPSIALGNILGGIAIQTVLLAFFDFKSRKEIKPLSTITSNTNSISQGVFLALILALVLLGSQLDSMYVSSRISIIEVLILIAWVLSLLTLKRCEAGNLIPMPEINANHGVKITRKKAIISIIGIALVILFFGYILAETSEHISRSLGISGVVFGATILSFITALPEISGGIAFVKSKSYNVLISDIFGGNSFLPLLFLLASILNKGSILPEAQKTDLFLTALSIVLTLIFVIGMIIKFPKRKYGLGIDSWAAIAIYILGMIGLIFI